MTLKQNLVNFEADHKWNLKIGYGSSSSITVVFFELL